MSRKSKTPNAGVLRTLRARAQSVTMHVTEEDDWDTDVPNVRFSRIIGVVVLLHVIAVGGILTFNQIGKKDDEAERFAASTPKAQSTTKLSPNELVPQNSRAPKFGDPSVRGLQHYRVTSGDNLMTIARQFDVPLKELEEVNRLGSGASLHAGAILFIPNKTITANAANDVQSVVDNQRRGVIPAHNKADGGGVVPVAMNPAVLEVEAPRAIPVTPAPAPAPPARPAVVAQQTPPPAPAKPAVAPTKQQKQNVRAVVQFYTVKKGDTAYRLGKRFGITPKKLLQINGIADAHNMQVGQKIRVPMKTQ
ncbi:LysM peptidoglycan-binding domain-containing protein [Verrucomicrobiales bacterium]|nr:LysM peptidoglycan-binding domain-containing protein [Verrucomicrobiales bacterium]